MGEIGGAARAHGTFVTEPSSRRADILRYGLAMVVVGTLGALALVAAGHQASGDVVSEVDSAILIDLPPADASSAPASDAAEGPRQRATQASQARQAPERVDPQKEPPKQVEDPKPAPEEAPAPPVKPDPAAVIEKKQEETPTPPATVAAPAAQAQLERAPSGADQPSKTLATDAGENRPHASKHAITLWQRSLLERLETARRLAARKPHANGTVKVAFSIDRTGSLASERVEAGSGSSVLDQAALLIIREAAPFAAPPAGSSARDTQFIMSIRFR